MSFFDFFVSSTLANPEVSLERAREIVRDPTAATASHAARQSAGLQRPGRASPATARAHRAEGRQLGVRARELEAQNDAMAGSPAEFPTPPPVVVPHCDGPLISPIDVAGESCIVRLVTYVEGELLAAAAYLSPAP